MLVRILNAPGKIAFLKMCAYISISVLPYQREQKTPCGLKVACT